MTAIMTGWTAPGCDCHDDVICASHQHTYRCPSYSGTDVVEHEVRLSGVPGLRCEMWRGHGRHHANHEGKVTFYWTTEAEWKGPKP